MVFNEEVTNHEGNNSNRCDDVKRHSPTKRINEQAVNVGPTENIRIA